AFFFTWPTPDRRGQIDRIRLAVGAGDLVSKATLKEIQEEKWAAGARAPASADVKKLAPSRGVDPGTELKGSLVQQKRQLVRNISFYCNEEFNRQACANYLTYCGESCKLMVKKDLWVAMMSTPTTTSKASAAPMVGGPAHTATASRTIASVKPV